MSKKFIVGFLFVCLSGIQIKAGEIIDTSYITIVFAGDVMGHGSQINSAYNSVTNKYVYDSCFKYISPFIQSADIAVANLEVTLGGSPFTGYPQFSSPDNLAIALKNAGFDILITANNHSIDRGKKGVERTIDVLDSLDIIHTGTFKHDSIRALTYPLIIERNNIKLALLNYTYGTNGLKVNKPNVVNYIDTGQIRNDLIKAKRAGPDFIFVTIHWGIEYERAENKTQSDLARFIISQGADAIFGSHPHVVQPIKRLYKNPDDSLNYNIVVYSLGNYISNQRNQYTDGGIMFEIKLMKTEGTAKVSSYNYLPIWVYKPVINSKTYFTIVPANAFLYGLGSHKIPEQSLQSMQLFYNDTKDLLKDIPENSFFYYDE